MNFEYFDKFGYPQQMDDIREYWRDWKVTNKRQFLNDLELEEHINSMSDRALSEFTARQTYDVCNLAGSNERRIVELEGRGNKFIASIGLAGAFVGAVIIAIVNYFAGK